MHYDIKLTLKWSKSDNWSTIKMHLTHRLNIFLNRWRLQMCFPDSEVTIRSSAVNARSDIQEDMGCNSRPQSTDTDSSIELSTGWTRETGSIPPSLTSPQTGSRSRDGIGKRSRIVPSRTCVQRQQSRDQIVADGTQVIRNWRHRCYLGNELVLLPWQPVLFAASMSSLIQGWEIA